jgi:Arc/MetJ family transcription regulator
MAITSVDVDQAAIREVRELLGLKSDREVINQGVALLLAKARQKDALRRIKQRTFTDDQLEDTTIKYSL